MGAIGKAVRAWALAAALAAGGGASAQTGDLSEADRKAIAEIAAAADARDCGTVLKRGGPLVDRRQRPVPEDVAAALYELIAGCHLDAKRIAEAYDAALRGTALAAAAPRLWYLRIAAADGLKRYDEAAATIEAMTEGHGAALNEMPLDWVWSLLNEMKREGATQARLRALKVLAGDSYAPTEAFGSNDGFRLSYAKEALAAGDTATAGPVVRSLETPESIAAASVDPRMRGFLSSVDVKAAAEKMLARHREWMARQPDRLRPLIAVAANLRQLGRRAEALQILRTAEPRLEKLLPDDDAGHVNWWWNELALTYESLGRADETIAAYRSGMAASEGGKPNVSQLINLAHAQNRFGRPEDALHTLAMRDLSTSGASPYGIMLHRQARACARHLLGRGGEAAADVDYIKAHEKDAPAAVTDLFLCLGDMDAAAASAIRRLDDPALRAELLLELSDYELAPPDLATDRVAANLQALKKRADVQAAIARAGGIRRFNIAEI